jgi:hypothetical protein
MPTVDLGLQGVTVRQQFAVLRRQIAHNAGKSRPKRVGRNPGFRGGLFGDEIKQDGRNLQSVGVDTIHDGFFSQQTTLEARSSGNFEAKNAPEGPQVSMAF